MWGKNRLKHARSCLCGFSQRCQCSHRYTKVNVRCGSLFAAGDTCKLVLFIHISNDATWLFTRRKNVVRHWLRSILAFFTPLKINTLSQVIESFASLDCLTRYVWIVRSCEVMVCFLQRGRARSRAEVPTCQAGALWAGAGGRSGGWILSEIHLNIDRP